MVEIHEVSWSFHENEARKIYEDRLHHGIDKPVHLIRRGSWTALRLTRGRAIGKSATHLGSPGETYELTETLLVLLKISYHRYYPKSRQINSPECTVNRGFAAISSV